MPVFLKSEENLWESTPIASGPFNGLQGGAVAALLVAELEQIASDQGLGSPLAASVEFLRPAGHGTLRTSPKIVRQGKRASFLTNRVTLAGEVTATASVCCINAIDLEGVELPPSETHDLNALAVLPARKAPHGGPWMMDNFEVRASPKGIAWFRYIDEIVEGMGPMARVLGPADWTHGIARPAAPKLADPNLNLQVSLFRHPVGRDIGIVPKTTWMPTGIGLGEGQLYDAQGPIGRVMMSVALTSFS